MIDMYGADYPELHGMGLVDDEDLPVDGIKSAVEGAGRDVKPAGKEEWDVTFEDVCGYENVKAALLRICDMAKNAGKYTKLGVRMPHGVMLYGKPGVARP